MYFRRCPPSAENGAFCYHTIPEKKFQSKSKPETERFSRGRAFHVNNRLSSLVAVARQRPKRLPLMRELSRSD